MPRLDGCFGKVGHHFSVDFEKHLKKFRTTQRFDVGQKSKYQEMLVRAGKVSNTDIQVIGNLRGSSAVDNV